MLSFSIFSKADVSALVWCLSVLLTVRLTVSRTERHHSVSSLIVFICTVTYELNDDDDDDDDDGDDMGLHSVTFHPTQVNTPRLNHNHSKLVLDLPTPEG